MSDKFRAVEGGQLFMHRLRMFRQTLKIALTFASALCVIVLVVVLMLKFDWYDGYTAIMCWWAKAKISMQVFIPKSYHHLDIYLRDMSIARVDSIKYINDAYVHATTLKVQQSIKEVLFYSPLIFFVSAVGSVMYFGRFSKQQRSSLSSKQILRGQQLVSPKEITSLLRKKGAASDLNLDGLPLVKNKETSHFLFSGTTGSGKTNAFHTLLPQISQRGDRAIVVDTTGDLVFRYYRTGQDVILNPLDERGQGWNLWEECQDVSEVESFAEAFIPQKGRGQDPFWETASRKILTVAIEQLEESQDIKELYDYLVTAEAGKYHSFFAGTDAAPFTDKAGERTTTSIRATLASQVASFRYLKKGGEFSIRRWIEAGPENQWLFLTAAPSQRSLLRPLMSAWLNVAVNGLMSLAPDATKKLWFIIDELPSLNNLPALITGLAELRKYGGCIIAGIQSFPQLETIYGRSISRSMLDLFNTKLMFRTTDPETAQWVSKVIGENEYAESQENLSFGANTIRDGVSLSKTERIRQIVLPSEIANLQDLECFVKFPGNYPATRIKMKYKKPA
ncbi:MAG: type IV conjugative transfer system coupling protein TraD [Pseudomonadota bacterium]